MTHLLYMYRRANFQKLSDDTGIDFINHPELILEEANSVIAAIWYWNSRGLNKYADKDDALSVSKVVNLGNAKAKGTPKHLAEREQWTETFKKEFK